MMNRNRKFILRKMKLPGLIFLLIFFFCPPVFSWGGSLGLDVAEQFVFHNGFMPEGPVIDHIDPLIINPTISNPTENLSGLEDTGLNVFTASRPEYVINHEYPYEDHDLDALLHLRAREENFPLNRTVIIRALSDSSDELENILTEEMNNYSRRVINHTTRPAPRTILIPINLSAEQHWVGIVVRLDGANRVLRIQYVDSLSRNGVPAHISELLGRVYNFSLIEHASRLIQPRDDSTSCGPLAIENIIRAVKDYVGREHVSYELLNSIRRHHINFAEKYLPGLRFKHRQTENLRSYK